MSTEDSVSQAGAVGFLLDARGPNRGILLTAAHRTRAVGVVRSARAGERRVVEADASIMSHARKFPQMCPVIDASRRVDRADS